MAVKEVSLRLIDYKALQPGDRVRFTYVSDNMDDPAWPREMQVETVFRQVTVLSGQAVNELVVTGPRSLIDDLRSRHSYLSGEYLLRGEFKTNAPGFDDQLRIGSTQGRGGHVFCDDEFTLVEFVDMSDPTAH